MASSDYQPCAEFHFGFPLIVPLPSCDVEDTSGSRPFPHYPFPACHRLYTGEASAFFVPVALSRPSSSLRHLDAGSALSFPALPASTARFCSRCLIGRSLPLRPAALPCIPDWEQTIPLFKEQPSRCFVRLVSAWPVTRPRLVSGYLTEQGNCQDALLSSH